MIRIQAWHDNFHPGILDLGLLVQTDKLKGILKLYTEQILFQVLFGQYIETSRDKDG